MSDLVFSFPIGTRSLFLRTNDMKQAIPCPRCGYPHSFDFVGEFRGIVEQVEYWAILTPVPCPSCGALPTMYSSVAGDTFHLMTKIAEVGNVGHSRN